MPARRESPLPQHGESVTGSPRAVARTAARRSKLVWALSNNRGETGRLPAWTAMMARAVGHSTPSALQRNEHQVRPLAAQQAIDGLDPRPAKRRERRHGFLIAAGVSVRPRRNIVAPPHRCDQSVVTLGALEQRRKPASENRAPGLAATLWTTSLSPRPTSTSVNETLTSERPAIARRCAWLLVLAMVRSSSSLIRPDGNRTGPMPMTFDLR